MFDWLINLFLGLGLLVEIAVIAAAVLLVIVLVRANRIVQRTQKMMDDVDQAGRWLGRLSWSRGVGRFLKLLIRQTDAEPPDDKLSRRD